MRDTRLKDQRGFALILSLFVIAILSILALGFLTTSMNEVMIARNYTNQIKSFYAAEAGLEWGIVNLRTLLVTTTTPTDGQMAAIGPPPLNNTDYTFTTFQVEPVQTTPPYDYPTIIANGPHAGLNAMATDYRITTVTSGPGGSQAWLSQVVKYLRIPLFQFGAFYGEGVDFEAYAGPAFTFSGRVHANNDIYLADSAGDGMFFDSSFTAAGSFYRRRKDQACCVRDGNPDVKDGGGAYQNLNFDREVKNISADGSTWETGDIDYWRTETLNRFGGKVQDSAHGVGKIVSPAALYDSNNPDVSSHLLIERGDFGDSQALIEAKLYYRADLRIHADVAGNTTATDKIDNAVDLSGCNITSKTFYDKREEATMNVTQVDIDALENCGRMPANGILYVYRDATNAVVRLVNGSALPSQGLTVVSENPVYIQGDYNTVNKVPAAVLGDAITVLSNNWAANNYDSKGDIATSSRQAAETTVNAALAMGPHAETAPGAGNGEFNNLIRFLEDWDNVNFNYKGSVVALWHSQQATGPWRCCGNSGDNYYRPPIRNWAYDTLFDTNPPPGTPMGIGIIRGQWSQK